MLREKLSKYNIILASGSPRRQAFFKDLDIDYEIRIKEVEEVYPKELKGAEITDFLADLKSQPFNNELTKKDILITSDTIVWFKNEALGKPKNYEDAFNMIKKMSGKKHDVITSVSIKGINCQTIINDVTIVYFKDLSDEEISYYINKYKPYDKAGAYGIQEWIGRIGITKIEGSYFNVMGLPVHKLYDELLKLD
ncbi:MULTISPECIES: Maf family nucleotide pyrophosphatase [Tenacibaculum]|uniref:Maf family nucleotide pyrophosphatase n=1 Tax=Tenacibaculum TaxID=104267 RepID=UPI001F0B016F|nr:MULTISPECIES: Maf family nucleotide pyrophosphatase [Tenacibaculum]MCH3882056.1 Maf family nucleotide pyrophosphatase [Tenacibaculum aquimarinum]MDO6599697.1 Maf family nucleotide pyrophosphatase [Tenacibaculum sp. 1_MG-2023]